MVWLGWFFCSQSGLFNEHQTIVMRWISRTWCCLPLTLSGWIPVCLPDLWNWRFSLSPPPPDVIVSPSASVSPACLCSAGPVGMLTLEDCLASSHRYRTWTLEFVSRISGAAGSLVLSRSGGLEAWAWLLGWSPWRPWPWRCCRFPAVSGPDWQGFWLSNHRQSGSLICRRDDMFCRFSACAFHLLFSSAYFLSKYSGKHIHVHPSSFC